MASVADLSSLCIGGVTSGDKMCTECPVADFNLPAWFLLVSGLPGGAVCVIWEVTSSREVVGPDAATAEMAGAG